MINISNQPIEILLPISINHGFTYNVTEGFNPQVGQFVQVPFRHKIITGVVWNTKSQFSSTKIKSIINSHDLFLKPTHIEFLKIASNYNMIPIGQLLKMSIGAFNIKKTTIENSESYLPSTYSLSSEQNKALQQLIINCQTNRITALEGVTGSGKTLVYSKLIEKLTKISGQVLILLPEIALTTQILDRIKAALPNKNILQWHSSITPKKKQEIWSHSIHGDPMIIIGARSALFLPFTDLKLIVVDEEHDISFKQDEMAIYNARDMAVLKGKCENIPVLLCSATLSIETIHNVNIKKYAHVKLTNRFSGVSMPYIEIINMTEEALPKNQFLSKKLLEEIKKTIDNKNQVLLFLNRKGYAPIAICSKCGTKSKCPNCSSWLVFYKKKSHLQCNYCGYISDLYKLCSNCNSDKIIFYGPGVEKIAEEVNLVFPSARITIATSETFSNSKNSSAILQQITNHETDIIIGTQVLAKGLDFKLLQLVGVIDADCHHSIGDLRANEKMYQLLSQVSGRAGRQKEQGKVILQAYEPDNHILQNIISYNTEQFISSELEDREISNTPPFSRLALINLEGKDEKQLLSLGHSLSDHVKVLENIILFGPSPAPMSLLKGKYRYRFILKAEKNIPIQPLIKKWLNAVKIPSSIKIKIDIDPYNFY